MKLQTYFSLAFMLCIGINLNAQTFSETIKKEAQFSSTNANNLLVVYNIEGSVTVEGYQGSTIKIEAKKLIEGNNSRQVDQGKTEIGVKITKHNNIIYVYLDSPYTKFNPETGRFSHNQRWNDPKYSHRLDYTIKVPMKTSVELSTVNRGDILVKNIRAKDITVKNINGAIDLVNVSGKTYVNALNRDINISYTENPKEDSTYESLNGDINISVKQGLNADVTFKSLNGEIYTNLETQSMPSLHSISKKKGKHGTKYKMNSDSAFKIGQGGVALHFKLLNGDVTIKE